jgi:Icc-related predicted phosphoesterase
MASERVTRILCAANPSGSVEALEALFEATQDSRVDAVALVGNLGGSDGGESLRSIFKALARTQRHTYWVPGPNDAPIESYLREAANIEVVAQSLRGVHGGVAFSADGQLVFAGFGGEVSDELDAPRDEIDHLRYPRWEAEYRLKVLHELDEHQFVLLFWTPPAHKGLNRPGAEVLAELIATHRPRLAVSAGEQGKEMIGRTLIVSPGNLQDGEYAIADVHSHDVQFERLAAGARTS